MGFDDLHNTAGLVLGLGLVSSPNPQHMSRNASPSQNLDEFYDASLNLSLSGETFKIQDAVEKMDCDKKIKVFFNDGNQLSCGLYRQDSSAASSSAKRRDREFGCSEDDDDDDGSNGRKKLRLNKVQSALLEESFKIHTTLNPKQKQDLAKELKLRPRQVEVWFQNRRARTKMKQTEVECELLKKCCETLTDENRQLQKELQALKLAAQPLYMQLPTTTLTMCPSCERVGAASSASASAAETKSSFTMAMATKPRFYNPFNSPSAAY